MTRHACRRDLPEPMVFDDYTAGRVDECFSDVDDELVRVDVKFGTQSLTLFDWQSILTEEVGEVAAAINDYHFHDSENLQAVYEECIQAAAVAVHMAAILREAP